jgi:hypothetical protein
MPETTQAVNNLCINVRKFRVCDTTPVKVDRRQFESIVGNLLKQKPATRDQEKTGTRKHSGKIIQPKTGSAQDRQPASDTSTAKS